MFKQISSFVIKSRLILIFIIFYFFEIFSRMCEIVGKRFVKVWCHPSFIYKWTSMYKTQTQHCDNINVFTSRVSDILCK